MSRRIRKLFHGILFRWILLVVTTLLASSANAHPISVSFVELRLQPTGIEASIEVQNVDLLHDFPDLDRKAVSTTVKFHWTEVTKLLTSRMVLSAHGSALNPKFQSISNVADQDSTRLRLFYPWVIPPTALKIECRLFPYHPLQQTLLDIYEGGALRREIVFDERTSIQEYRLGSHQSTGSVVQEFLIQGIEHIFTGPDHILFIVGLLLLGGTLKQLLKIVTAFTLAHSVTLCLAALNILTPPARVIEPTIALSIVFVGVHGLTMIRRRSKHKPVVDTRIWFAFGFGFIHGFGFANALRELQLPQQALVAALFSFNLGVECGQACIVLAVAPLLGLLRRKNFQFAQSVAYAGSLVVIAMGGWWFVQRVLTP